MEKDVLMLAKNVSKIACLLLLQIVDTEDEWLAMLRSNQMLQ